MQIFRNVVVLSVRCLATAARCKLCPRRSDVVELPCRLSLPRIPKYCRQTFIRADAGNTTSKLKRAWQTCFKVTMTLSASRVERSGHLAFFLIFLRSFVRCTSYEKAKVEVSLLNWTIFRRTWIDTFLWRTSSCKIFHSKSWSLRNHFFIAAFLAAGSNSTINQITLTYLAHEVVIWIFNFLITL